MKGGYVSLSYTGKPKDTVALNLKYACASYLDGRSVVPPWRIIMEEHHEEPKRENMKPQWHELVACSRSSTIPLQPCKSDVLMIDNCSHL